MQRERLGLTPRRGRVVAALLPVFVAAGLFKASPAFAWLPVDLTLALAVVIALACANTILGCLRRGEPAGLAWMVGAVAVTLLGVYLAPGTEYAGEKVRALSLTLCAFAAGLLLLRTVEQRRWFAWAVVAVGLAVTVLYVVAPTTADLYGRVALEGSNTIAPGRHVGAALVVVVTLAVAGRLRLPVTAVVVAPLLVLLLGTGSRGPLVAVLLAGLALVPLMVRARHRARSLLLVALAVVAGLWAFGQSARVARDRILLLVADDKGVSVMERQGMWDAGWDVVAQEPLGLGWGGLAPYLRPNLYPHNVVVEVGAEVGWLGLAALAVLLVVAYRRGYRAAREGSTSAYVLVALLTFWLGNALVSGDVNDNRGLWLLAAACVALRSGGVGDEAEGGELGEQVGQRRVPAA